jgi:membrane protease YdiL (CAAX protease family)
MTRLTRTGLQRPQSIFLSTNPEVFQLLSLDAAEILSSVIVWAIITAPVCEEILFRGLAVKALQSRGFARGTIWLITTAAFAAIHLPYFGVASTTYIFAWGGVVTAIRLWRRSLTPGLILGSDSHPMNFSAELAVLQRGNQRHASRYSNFVVCAEWVGN